MTSNNLLCWTASSWRPSACSHLCRSKSPEPLSPPTNRVLRILRSFSFLQALASLVKKLHLFYFKWLVWTSWLFSLQRNPPPKLYHQMNSPRETRRLSLVVFCPLPYFLSLKFFPLSMTRPLKCHICRIWRRSSSETRIFGTAFPKDVDILIPVDLVHSSDSNFSHPDDFKPERYYFVCAKDWQMFAPFSPFLKVWELGLFLTELA